MSRKIFNLVGLQLGWYACALGAARDASWIGLLVVGVFLSVHLLWSPNRTRELALVFNVGLLGTVIDSLQKTTGLLSYGSDSPVLSWLCPMWITALWLLLGSSLNTSLAWLRDRYLLAAALGAVFGPLSYLAGARLGAIDFNLDVTVTSGVLALIWGSVMPVLVWMAKQIVTQPDDPHLAAGPRA
jgi:hypothetical protein